MLPLLALLACAPTPSERFASGTLSLASLPPDLSGQIPIGAFQIAVHKANARLVLQEDQQPNVKFTLVPLARDEWPFGCADNEGPHRQLETWVVVPSKFTIGPLSIASAAVVASCGGGVSILPLGSVLNAEYGAAGPCGVDTQSCLTFSPTEVGG